MFGSKGSFYDQVDMHVKPVDRVNMEPFYEHLGNPLNLLMVIQEL